MIDKAAPTTDARAPSSPTAIESDESLACCFNFRVASIGGSLGITARFSWQAKAIVVCREHRYRSGMPDQPLPEYGEIWVKRKTGERFEVWSSHPRWVIVHPLRDGNRRPVHVITNNFFQEFVRDADAR
jgi:hypothetical protein